MKVISGHRDSQLTACPGGNLYQRIPTIRKWAAAEMGSSLIEPTVSTRSVPMGADVDVAVKARVTQRQSWTLTVREFCSGRGRATDHRIGRAVRPDQDGVARPQRRGQPGTGRSLPADPHQLRRRDQCLAVPDLGARRGRWPSRGPDSHVAARSGGGHLRAAARPHPVLVRDGSGHQGPADPRCRSASRRAGAGPGRRPVEWGLCGGALGRGDLREQRHEGLGEPGHGDRHRCARALAGCQRHRPRVRARARRPRWRSPVPQRRRCRRAQGIGRRLRQHQWWRRVAHAPAAQPARWCHPVVGRTDARSASTSRVARECPRTPRAVVLAIRRSGDSPVGSVSAWPAGGDQPSTPTWRRPRGSGSVSQVVVPLGTGGGIRVAADRSGPISLDVAGYVASGNDRSVHPVVPRSLLGDGVRLDKGDARTVSVRGRAGVPSGGQGGRRPAHRVGRQEARTAGPVAARRDRAAHR